MNKNNVRWYGIPCIVIIICIWVMGKYSNLDTADCVSLTLTTGLVFTAFTATISAQRQVEETKKARQAAFRPILSIDEYLTAQDKIFIGLAGREGSFPRSWPCNIRNIGVGPAIAVEWSIHSGLISKIDDENHHDKDLAAKIEDSLLDKMSCSVIETDGTANNGPHKLLSEMIDSDNSKKVIRVYYEDIFGNKFESYRKLWLEGENPILGPLQIRGIEQENKQ